MKLTYYGHSCFEVEVAGKKLLFDPFITPNPLAAGIDITQLKPDYIFLSHGHYDHVADVEAIVRHSGAMLVGSYEVVQWFLARVPEISKSHSMNLGGRWNFDFGEVMFTTALHSSSMPDGAYGGHPGGFLVKTMEGSFYYSGDTALMHDMAFYSLSGSLLFALLCIGDNFTMGVEDAVAAANLLDCKEIVGVHYDTFSPIKIDHEFAKKSFEAAGKRLHLLPIGMTLTF